MLLRPFTVGDYIIENTNKQEGTVVKIDLFYTTLSTGLTAFSYLMSLAFVAGRNETFGQARISHNSLRMWIRVTM